MGDFLIWLSPLAVPTTLQRRFHWSASGRIGVRKTTAIDLGQARSRDRELVFVGQGRGERGNRHFPPPNPLAHRLLTTLTDRGPKGLDDQLGPIAGAMVEADGKRAMIWRDRFGRQPLQMIRLQIGWACTTSPEVCARLLECRPRWSNLSAFVHDDHATTDADVAHDLFRVRPSEYIAFEEHRIETRAKWWTPRQETIDDPIGRMTSLLHEMGHHYGRSPHIVALSAGLDSATLAAFMTGGHPTSEAITFCDPVSAKNEGPQAAQLAADLDLKWSAFDVSNHWPLSRPPDHRFPLLWGPAAHPDFAWKMPFHRWLERRRPNLPLMYGNGADDVLWFPPRLWLESRWRHRDWSALALARQHLPWSQWLRPGLSQLIDDLHLRPVRSMMGPPPEPTLPIWHQPSRWIRTSPCGEPTDHQASSPMMRFFDLRLQRLQTWRWERVMRSLAFEQRRTRRQIWTPFLDAQFWELSLSLGPKHLVEGGRQKAILRRAGAALLPDDCRQRPKIGGFDSLVERGLADRAPQRVYSLFARPHLARWSAFDTDAFLRAYDAYRRTPTSSTVDGYRGSWPIWKTVAAEMWLRRADHSSPPQLRL